MSKIVSTVAAPNANSYLSWDEIQEMMLAQDPEWGDRTEMEQENIAVGGAADIDRLRFIGQPCYPTQKRAFPRNLDIFVNQVPLTDGTAVLVPYDAMHYTSVSDFNPDYDPANPDEMWWSYVECTYSNPQAQLPVQDATGAWVYEEGDVYLSTVSAVFSLAGVSYTESFNAQVSSVIQREALYTVTYDAPALKFTFTSLIYGAYCRDYVFNGSAFDYERVTFSDAVMDTTSNFPDVYKSGSVHVLYADGARSFHDITEHNILTGTVKITPPADTAEVSSYILHKPIITTVKEAQLVQMLVRVGATDGYDPFVGGGIARIKIGDTERDYSAPRYGGLGLRELANRNRVSEQVFVLIGHFTVYGKFGITYEQERAELYLGATSGGGTEA